MSLARLARFSRMSVVFCHSGANDRRCAGSASLTGRLSTICAGEAAPERGVFLNNNKDLANLLASNDPDVQDPALIFFMLLTVASVKPFD